MEIKEELFATFELSKLAKEKGFDEECFCYFELGGDKVGYLEEIVYYELERRNSTINIIDSECTAPLYDQIINWLETNHKIFINVIMNGEGFDQLDENVPIGNCLDKYVYYYDVSVFDLNKNKTIKIINKQKEKIFIGCKTEFTNRREALNEAIKQGLNLIK